MDIVKNCILFFLIFLFCHEVFGVVGDSVNLNVKNFNTSGYSQVTATCQSIEVSSEGTVELLVDNNIIQEESITQNIFENFYQSIYPYIHENYGKEGDVDSSKSISILITKIEDTSKLNKAYFSKIDFHPSTESGYENSNFREILYVDYDFYNFEPNECMRQLTVAFTEMVCNSYSQDKSKFLIKGISEYSAYMAGYGIPDSFIDAYRINNVSLFPNSENDAFMGKVFMFIKYLVNEYGNNIVKEIAQDTGTSGREIIETYTGENFNDIFMEFSKLLYCPISYGDFQKSTTSFFYNYPLIKNSLTLPSYESVGIRLNKFWPKYFLGIENFVNSSGDNAVLKAELLLFKNNVLDSIEVLSAENGAKFTPRFDYDCDKVILLLTAMPESNTADTFTLDLKVIESDNNFYVFSNPIFRNQVMVFFKNASSINSIILIDPNKTQTQLNVHSSSVHNSTGETNNFSWYSWFIATLSGKYQLIVNITDTDGNTYEKTHEFIVGQDELDNTKY